MKSIGLIVVLSLSSIAYSKLDGLWYVDASLAPEILKEENKEFVDRAFGPYAVLVRGTEPLTVLTKSNGNIDILYPNDIEPKLELTPIENGIFKGSDGKTYELKLIDELLEIHYWEDSNPETVEMIPLKQRTSEQCASHNAGKPAS